MPVMWCQSDAECDKEVCVLRMDSWSNIDCTENLGYTDCFGVVDCTDKEFCATCNCTFVTQRLLRPDSRVSACVHWYPFVQSLLTPNTASGSGSSSANDSAGDTATGDSHETEISVSICTQAARIAVLHKLTLKALASDTDTDLICCPDSGKHAPHTIYNGSYYTEFGGHAYPQPLKMS